MTAYTITSGQGGPTGPEQVMKPGLAVSDSAIETEVNDINSFLTKLAALENKSRLLNIRTALRGNESHQRRGELHAAYQYYQQACTTLLALKRA